MKYFSVYDIEKAFPDITVIGDKSKKFNNFKALGEENKYSIIWF